MNIDQQVDANGRATRPPPDLINTIDVVFRVVAAAILLASADFTQLFPETHRLVLMGSLLASFIYIAVFFMAGQPDQDTAEEDDEAPPSATTAPTREMILGQRRLPACLDAFVLGVLVMLLEPHLLVVTIIATLVMVRALAQGGVVEWLVQMPLLAAGALAVLALRYPSVPIHLEGDISLIALAGAPLFLCFLAYQLYCREQALAEALRAADLNAVQLKLNNYKLAKYLSPSLRKAIFSGKRVALETQRKRVTVFFSDIRGFSELSEELDTEALTNVLNLYLTEMSDIAIKFGGTVDKFIGDAVMVFFGDPVSRGAREDALACVSMAIAMQKRMTVLNQRWQAQGVKQPLQVRMGVNTGFCTVGNFGTESRLEYTLLGTEVNKASRLESAAGPGEVLVSRPTWELVRDTVYCESRGEVQLKGFRHPVEVFAAIDLRSNLGKQEPRVEYSSEGFNMVADLDHIPAPERQRIMATLEKVYNRLRR